MTIGLILQALNGLVWGLIVALMSVGLNLIYGVLGVINVAHGAFYMLGAVGGWLIAERWGFWSALALAPLTVALIGVAAERWTLRPLLGRPVMTLLATFGLMLVAQQAVILQMGTTVRRLSPPWAFTVHLLGVPYSGYRLFVAGAALGVMGLLWLFLHKTRLGTWVRAVRQNPELALALGIPVSTVYALAFGLGAGLAALAGVLTAPLVSVYAYMGLDILLLSFLVVIVGGVGHLGGAALVAVLARLSEGILSTWVQPTEAQLLTLLLLAGLLLWRPEGLFGGRA